MQLVIEIVRDLNTMMLKDHSFFCEGYDDRKDTIIHKYNGEHDPMQVVL